MIAKTLFPGASRESLLVQLVWIFFPFLTNWLQQGHSRPLLSADNEVPGEVNSRSYYIFGLEWRATIEPTSEQYLLGKDTETPMSNVQIDSDS